MLLYFYYKKILKNIIRYKIIETRNIIFLKVVPYQLGQSLFNAAKDPGKANMRFKIYKYSLLSCKLKKAKNIKNIMNR